MASWTVLSRRLRLTLLHGWGASGVAGAWCRPVPGLWEMLMLCEVPCVSGRRVGDGCAVWSGTRAWQGSGRGRSGAVGGEDRAAQRETAGLDRSRRLLREIRHSQTDLLAGRSAPACRFRPQILG